MQFKKSLLSLAIGSVIPTFAFAQGQPSPELEEVRVLGQYIPDEKRETSEISEVFDSEDFAVSGDGVVGDALQRLPGISLVGGKFIYVRGLGERYSSTLFNGSFVSSPVPLQKTVPLDIFPSSVVGSVLVQKTYSPEYPGDFSGGLVVIRSKNLPDENFLSVSLGTGANSASTFEDGYLYAGGDDDSFGRDDGTRQLPLNISATSFSQFNEREAVLEENIAFTKSFPNRWDLRRQDNPADEEFSVSLGRLVDFDSGLSLGALIAYDQSDETRNRNREKNRFTYGTRGAEGDQTSDLQDELTQRQIGSNLLIHLGADFENTELTFTRTSLGQTTDDTQFQLGRTEDLDETVGSYRYQWVENEIESSQLIGTHWFLNESLSFNWRIMDGEARRDSPDTRTYSYFLDRNTNNFRLVTSNDQFDSQFIVPTPLRNYSNLRDNIDDFGVDFDWNFFIGDMDVSLRWGGASSTRERRTQRREFRFEFDLVPQYRDFLVLTLESLFSPIEGGFVDRGLINVTDQTQTAGQALGRFPFAESSEDLDAAYFSLDSQVTSRIRVRLGVRAESVEYATDAYIDQPGLAAVTREEDNLLPAVSMTYEVFDNFQIRAAASSTVNRPSLSEIESTVIRNVEDLRLYRGNPDLAVSEIDNLDFRFELYFGDIDVVTLGLFYKDFDKPIVQAPFQSQDEIFTYVNGQEAELLGAEIDLTKQLTSNLSLHSNVSYIDSEVILQDNLSTPSTRVRGVFNQKRSLRGQSDELFNLRLTHQMDRIDWTNSLVYNYTSDRIAFVGAENAPDVIEKGRGVFDFVSRFYTSWSNDYDVEFSFKVKNMFDQEVKLVQGNNRFEVYDEGTTASFDVKLTF